MNVTETAGSPGRPPHGTEGRTARPAPVGPLTRGPGHDRVPAGPARPDLDRSSAAVQDLARTLRGRARATERRVVTVTATVLVIALAAAVLAVFVGGSASIPAADVLPAALGLRDGLADFVVHQTRVPRALTGLLAGALFGLAGATYQRLLRNPLATPDIIGISSGANLGAVIVIIALAGGGIGVQAAALVGATGLAGVIFWLSWKRGVPSARLVLIGIAMSAVCTAVTSYLVTRADDLSAERAYRWSVGSLSGATWDGVAVLAVSLAVGTLCVAALSRPLTAMTTGDDLALGLGARVVRTRAAALVVGAGLAAMATSVTGPIGFVSLVAGPVAVRLVRPGRELPTAAAVGALMVVGADVLAQNAPYISPIPTGTLTAILGAPYLIWLLLRRTPTR